MSSPHPEIKTDQEQTRGQEIESLNHHRFNSCKFIIFISFRVLTLFNSYNQINLSKKICPLPASINIKESTRSILLTLQTIYQRY
jgi:hypothetical protein